MNDSATPALPAISPPRRRVRVGVVMLIGAALVLVILSLYAWKTLESAPDSASPAIATVSVPPAQGVVVARVSIDQRREHVRRYPRDGRGWALLAYAEFEAQAYAEAAAAFEKAVTVSRKVAQDPGVLCDWADSLGMAQGGSLVGRPSELITRALALRPNYPKALEMAGSAAYEQRQFAIAADYWRKLLPQMTEGSVGRQALENAIVQAEQMSANSLPIK